MNKKIFTTIGITSLSGAIAIVAVACSSDETPTPASSSSGGSSGASSSGTGSSGASSSGASSSGAGSSGTTSSGGSSGASSSGTSGTVDSGADTGGGAHPSTADCQTLCQSIQTNCKDANKAYADGDACRTACATWEVGTAGAAAGNSYECRKYHNGVAAGDPTTHCPHLKTPSAAGGCL